LVALAISVDRLLALPADTLGWKLRMRLGEVRDILGVPVYPSLLAPDAPKDPEAPSPDLIERRPELAPRAVPVAEGAVLPRPNITGLLRGIQSGRHRELVKRAVDQGWDVAMTGGGHVALTRGHRRLVVSTTVREGRGRGWANLRAEAKRIGLDVGTL